MHCRMSAFTEKHDEFLKEVKLYSNIKPHSLFTEYKLSFYVQLLKHVLDIINMFWTPVILVQYFT